MIAPPSTTMDSPDRCNSTIYSQLKVLSRSSIHQLIANGHLIVIANTQVLKLDDWVNRHPGGVKTILHMVGRDATDEINMYVSKSVVHSR
jgi:delta8-fatty-acid desaturase